MSERISRATSSPWLVIAAFAAIYLIWGSTYLAIRFAIETMPPLLMAGVRFLVAGGLLYAWTRLSGTPRPTGTNWRAAALVGGLLLGGNGAVTWAEQWVPSGTAALLVATAPFWMAILETMRSGGERTNLRSGIGMIVVARPDKADVVIERLRQAGESPVRIGETIAHASGERVQTAGSLKL